MFPEWLLDELQCPHSGEPLTLATEGLLNKLHAAARIGKLRTKIGRPLAEMPRYGLVNTSQSWFYPVTDEGTVELLPDDAVSISID